MRGPWGVSTSSGALYVVSTGEHRVRVFNESVAYWGGLQGDGKIENFEVVLLSPHGGDLGGCRRCDDEGADGADGAHLAGGGVALPARDGGSVGEWTRWRQACELR